MNVQMPLGLRLNDAATFDSFCMGSNAQVLSSLRHLLQGTGESSIYLWGEPGVGKTHLLQACCHALEAVSRSVVYLPLNESSQLTPAMLEGMESMDLVCLDHIEAVMRQPIWEEALFHLYNRMVASGARLLIAAAGVPASLASNMPDLQSRLAHSLVLQVQPLNDEQKLAALQLRAKRRGLELSDDVGHYLLRHHPRHMAVLFNALEKLDEASLVMQRRLTIPFVKSVLDV